jgi:uroporphyrinogen decarboxylase
MNMICTAGEGELREYVADIVKCCAPGGGYALGTGNSVANYIPLQNYKAMLDVGRKIGVYPIVI